MTDQRFLEAMVNYQQVQIGIAVAVGLGVAHYDYETGMPRLMVHDDDIIRLLRTKTQIAISDPDKVLNTGPGVQIGETHKRWIARGDYAQAVQLLGAQTIDVMRQIKEKS